MRNINAAIINGGGGNDSIDLSSFKWNNTLYGGVGDDILKGGLGADTLSGGTGIDVFYNSGGIDKIIDYTASEKIYLGGNLLNNQTLTASPDAPGRYVDGFGNSFRWFGNALQIRRGVDDGFDLTATAADLGLILAPMPGADPDGPAGKNFTNQISPAPFTVGGSISGTAGRDNFSASGTSVTEPNVVTIHGGEGSDTLGLGTGRPRPIFFGEAGQEIVTNCWRFFGGSGNDKSTELVSSTMSAVPNGGPYPAYWVRSGGLIVDLGAGNDSSVVGYDSIYPPQKLADMMLQGVQFHYAVDGGVGSDTISLPAITGYSAKGGDGYDYLTVGGIVQAKGGNGTATSVAGTASFSGFEAISASSSTGVYLAGDAADNRFSVGNTTIPSASQYSQLFGGGGSDTLTGGNALLDGGAGRDFITATGVNTLLLGGDGADTLFGSVEADTFNGGAGADYIFAGSGNDVLIWQNGADTIDGGVGTDQLTVNLSAAQLATATAYAGGLAGWLGSQGVVLTGIETIVGTATSNQYASNAADNVVLGGALGGTLYALEGNDTLTGSSGNDLIDGGEGRDTFLYNLGQGSDTLFDNDGRADDVLQFGPGITAGMVSLSRNGDDLMVSITGGGLIRIDDQLDGIDLKIGTARFDNGDTLSLWVAPPTPLDPTLIKGTTAADILTGGTAAEKLAGELGADTLTGGAGADTFVGTAADWAGDVIKDYQAGDKLRFSGMFWISNSDVSSVLNATSTIFTVTNLDQTSKFSFTVTGYWGIGSAVIDGDDGLVTLGAIAPATIMLGTGGNDILAAPTATSRWIEGLGGNDLLTGSSLVDTLSGGDGADTLAGLGGADNINGGNGTDWIDYSGATTGILVSLLGGAASDGDILCNIEAIRGSAFTDTLIGGDGNDGLDGGVGNDVLTGGLGADKFRLVGAGLGNDTVTDFVLAQGDRVVLATGTTYTTTDLGTDIKIAANGNSITLIGVADFSATMIEFAA